MRSLRIRIPTFPTDQNKHPYHQHHTLVMVGRPQVHDQGHGGGGGGDDDDAHAHSFPLVGAYARPSSRGEAPKST